jgi:hypothetical protein
MGQTDARPKNYVSGNNRSIDRLDRVRFSPRMDRSTGELRETGVA